MTEESFVVPEEFNKVIKDFVGDLKTTFPEYEPLINKWWTNKSKFDYIEEEDERIKRNEEEVRNKRGAELRNERKRMYFFWLSYV